MATPIVFDIIARDKASKTFSKIGGAAKLLGVVGLGSVVKNAVDVEAAFSKSMNVLQAATSAGTSDMAKMTAQAKKLGADTSFSANEAAAAMLELGKAGFDTKQIMSAVPEVMNLAATEGMALADAAGAVTSALAQFGMNATKSAIVVNALAGASLASKASVSGLSQSLSLVGSSAASIGLNVQDTAAALAALAQGGLEGSIAGTSLSAVFNRLVPTTNKARDAMRELGIDFTNADGSFKDITQIAGILQRQFKGMDAETRNLRIGEIFGRDASTISAVNALIRAGAGGIKKYRKETQDQTAASRMSEAAMKGTNGALEKMQGSLETASLAIGTMLAPAVVFLADAVGSAANAFVAFTPKLQAVGGFIADHNVAFTALAATIGAVVAITKIHTAAMAVQAAGGLLPMLKATKLVSSATKAYTAMQWLLNAALTANPIGIVVVAIAGLVAAIVVAYKKSETFRRIVDGAFRAVKAAASFAFDWIKKNWPYLLGILTGPIGLAVLAIVKNWDKIKEGAAAVVEFVKGIPGKLGDLAGKFGNAGKDLIHAFVDGMKNAAGIITGIAGNVWNTVKDLLNDAIDKINAALEFKISLPGPDVNVNLPNIPHLARGGIVRARSGGTLALLGEGGHDEAVVPLSGPHAPKGGGGGAVVNINFNGLVGDPKAAAREVRKVLLELKRTTGLDLGLA